jgi:glutaredoxin
MRRNWLIYVRPGCGYSEKAKMLLDRKGYSYDIKVIEPANKAKEFENLRKQIGKHDTFPLVFHKDNFIGGYTELEKYVDEYVEGVDVVNDAGVSRKKVIKELVMPKGNRVSRTKFHGSPYYSYIAMVYLSKKHPNCCVVFPVDHPPEKHEQLSLRWNESEKRVTVPDNFWNSLKRCNGGKRFIVFPFGFSCKKSGHANYIIYDSYKRTMERFETHGDINEILDKSLLPCVDAPVDDHLQMLFEENMGRDFIRKYYKPLEFCPKLGFQTLQEKEPYKMYDPSGFCAAWSCWYADLRLLNGDVDSKTLIRKTIKALKSSPEKLTDFIRNYSQFIVDASSFIEKNDLTCKVIDGGSYCTSNN